MKNILIVLTLFAVLSCTSTKKQKTIDPTYNSKADIGLFLSTSDKDVENQVLDRLKLNSVDSAQIKSLLLATLPASSQNPAGLQSNLKLKIKQKNIHMNCMFQI